MGWCYRLMVGVDCQEVVSIDQLHPARNALEQINIYYLEASLILNKFVRSWPITTKWAINNMLQSKMILSNLTLCAAQKTFKSECVSHQAPTDVSKEYEAWLDKVMIGNPRSDIEARVIVTSGPVWTESTNKNENQFAGKKVSWQNFHFNLRGKIPKYNLA